MAHRPSRRSRLPFLRQTGEPRLPLLRGPLPRCLSGANAPQRPAGRAVQAVWTEFASASVDTASVERFLACGRRLSRRVRWDFQLEKESKVAGKARSSVVSSAPPPHAGRACGESQICALRKLAPPSAKKIPRQVALPGEVGSLGRKSQAFAKLNNYRPARRARSHPDLRAHLRRLGAGPSSI